MVWRLLQRVVSVAIGPVVTESSRTTAAKTKIQPDQLGYQLLLSFRGACLSDSLRSHNIADVPRVSQVFFFPKEFSCHSRHGTRRPRDRRNARDGRVSLRPPSREAYLPGQSPIFPYCVYTQTLASQTLDMAVPEMRRHPWTVRSTVPRRRGLAPFNAASSRPPCIFGRPITHFTTTL